MDNVEDKYIQAYIDGLNMAIRLVKGCTPSEWDRVGCDCHDGGINAQIDMSEEIIEDIEMVIKRIKTEK